MRCTGFSLQWLLLLWSTGIRLTGFSSCGTRASVVVARGLYSAGSIFGVHGLSCSMACGIFPDQDSNPCPLHWQADSQPLRHQGSPSAILINTFFKIFSTKEFGIISILKYNIQNKMKLLNVISLMVRTKCLSFPNYTRR